MEVVSECPLTVGSVLWQSGPKAWTLTLVAKATFALAPGESPLAPTQEEVHQADRHWDNDPLRSLAIATDLVPFKRRPEVMVVGFAHAPNGQPVGSLVARVAIGSVDKGIEVRGDQHFTREGRLSDPVKFKRMPLRWERSAGGPDTSNPVGVPTGTDARFDSWGRCALPNLVPIGTMSVTPHDPIEPIGFAPIAPRWPARLARLAGLSDGFDPARWSATPLPEHFDAAYFNAAPRDQQMSVLDGTESLLLENLHPRHPVLATRLAPIRPLAAFEWGKGRSLDIGLTCDTLLVDAELGLATLAFRGHIALDHPGRAGRIVVSLETPVDPRASVPDWIHRVEDVVSTVAAVEGDDGSTLPFRQDEEMPTLPKRPRPLARPRTGTVQGTELAGPALPFRTAASAAGSATGTLLPFRAPSDPLPFRAPSDPDQTITVQGAQSPFAKPPPTFGLPSQAVPSPVVQRAPEPLPPPLVSALALLPGTHEETVDGDALVEDMEAIAAHAEHAEEIEPEPDEDEELEHATIPGARLPLDTHPLKRYARIAASLALRPAERAAILGAHDLDEPTWARLDAHFTRVLFQEAEQQKNTLLQQHDEAYIAQIEAERGPITAHEYARLVVASERGTADIVLSALRIPIEALMRIRRVWIARIARDMDLGMRVRKALAAERG